MLEIPQVVDEGITTISKSFHSKCGINLFVFSFPTIRGNGKDIFLDFFHRTGTTSGKWGIKKKLAIFNFKSHLTAIVILNKNFHKLFFCSLPFTIPFFSFSRWKFLL